MNRGRHKVTWFDGGRWPKNPPNPAYPEGIDIPCADPALPSCKMALPYPAKRIGQYVVECETCGITVIVTTAGRADDPRSVTLNCVVLQ
jgi:hypothetical protein